MSGHNPHSHLSQPNSSWNSLQIPSYIPRQPQLAHMSNERPLVRSPLTWHTPTRNDPLYSFMSANHKSLELNPLLPTFVRGPSPFGSVDLTIQSARNSTPSPRSLTSPPPDFAHSKSISRSLTPNSLTNSNLTPNSGVIQTTSSIRDNFKNANGISTEIISPGTLFVRDARQINNDLVKISAQNAFEVIPTKNEPVQLIKESTYQSVKNHAIPSSPKRLSPTIPLVHNTPVTSNSESCVPSLSNLCSSTDIVNNHMSIESQNIQTKMAETLKHDENPPVSNTQPSSPLPAVVLNEDSIDSNTSKARRKRKPDKTTRISKEEEEEITEDLIENPQILINLEKPNSVEEKEKEIEKVISKDEETVPQIANKNEIEKEKIDEQNNLKSLKDKIVEENQENKEIISLSIQNEKNSSINVEETSIEKSNPDVISEENVVKTDTADLEEVFKDKTNELIKNSDGAQEQKKEVDEIETIDKIAAMIANGTEEVLQNETIMENNLNKNTDSNIEPETSKNKINDLTEIFGPSCTNGDIETPIEHLKENPFEEVENKLEEMFAGIEDETPSNVNSIQTIVDQSCNEVTSDLGLDLPVNEKNENLSEKDNKQQNKSNKRSHSAKFEHTPSKKKKKVTKKNLNNQKTTKSNTKNNTNKLNKDKIKDDINTDIKYKGPYVQIKNDGSFSIINTSVIDDDTEKQNKVKKILLTNVSTERSKIRGLHISTLSTKYDADTTDKTWMCVFCKKGPHKMGLGDLFGPYVITTICSEFELCKKDPNDDEFISKRSKCDMIQKQLHTMPVVPANIGFNKNSNLNIAKKKQKTDEKLNINQFDLNEIFNGMSKMTDTSYEVWIHENCAVWAPGVHMVGVSIVGLEAAVWNSTRYKCSICSCNGAILSCLQRGCSNKAHIPCAKTRNWTLSENDFKIYCEKHNRKL